MLTPEPRSVIHEFAPAKLNLTLHITGRRADGYHDLDSLVAFVSVGDEVRLEPAQDFSFHIEGPQAAALKNEAPDNNLIVKAAKTLADMAGKKLNAKITLVKNLPVASGVGGGSSDATAALRALAIHWGIAQVDPVLFKAAAQHGQDVPLCLKIETSYLTADGMAEGPKLPHTDVVLVNPNKALPTPDVYKAYKDSGAAFSPLSRLEKDPANVQELVEALKFRHNDLYPPASYLMPEITAIIGVLQASEGCLLARMSGSGATCFGLYQDRAAARKAASDVMNAHPEWWVAQSYLPHLGDRRRI